MKTFYIYFSDLNDEAQKELLDLVGAKDTAEMNWDLDIVPLASIDFEGELIDAFHYCEELKELNSKFGVHGETYRVHDIGPNGIRIVKEYKRGQWGLPVGEEG